ncbi:hypothetical protein LC55x_4418 [Lysobacter capsici]|nr:hypothetical protein LC55x_4418 [Lysobacter capsici]
MSCDGLPIPTVGAAQAATASLRSRRWLEVAFIAHVVLRR